MNIKRDLLFIVFCFSLTTYLFAQNKPAYKVTKITEEIYELSIDEGGYPEKVIASVGDDGLLIVDSGSKENGGSLLETLKSFGKGLPKIIINTHSHIEHVGGNIAIGKGATIIAHWKMRERYTDGLYIFNEIPDDVLPQLTIMDSMNIIFNGEEIKLISFPGAHDNSDIIVWFTKSKIVCTAALCNNNHFPSIDGEMGDIRKYPETVASIIKLFPEDVRIIPGHSKDCGMKEFKNFYNMLVKTSEIIQSEISKGKNLNTIISEDILSDWKSWESYANRNYWILCWYNAYTIPAIEQGDKPKPYKLLYSTIKEKGADEAIKVYHYIKKNQSDKFFFDNRMLMYIGNRLTLKEKYDGVVLFYSECLKENPNRDIAAKCYAFLGNAYNKLGMKELALANYEKYLETYSFDQQIRDKVKALEKEK